MERLRKGNSRTHRTEVPIRREAKRVGKKGQVMWTHLGLCETQMSVTFPYYGKIIVMGQRIKKSGLWGP